MDSLGQNPQFFIDIFLQPGEFYFGDRESRIRTLLGSCVAITLWHPRLRVGGMCHYLLPSCSDKANSTELDGRYADQALQLFMVELEKIGSNPGDFEVKMFGGGNQFPGQGNKGALSVPNKNIHFGRSFLKQHGFTIKAEHLGGLGHRNVIFDVWSGHVWVKHVENLVAGTR